MSIIETHNCKICPCFIYKTCDNCPEYSIFADDCNVRASWENRCTVNDCINANSEESYTTEQAAQESLKWCEKHPGWKRICDIEDSNSLYKTWDELSEKEKKSWINYYGVLGAKGAWEEFGHKPCKVKYGFISGKGEFYKKVTDVPPLHNLMMVFKIG
jgi:hypothetical protein